MAVFLRSWWLLGALSLAGCGSSDVAGGSGTEAENALTVLARAQDGSRASGALVEVWPSAQVPALGGTAPSFRDTTDASGQARLVLPTGEWSVLVTKGGSAFWRRSGQFDQVQDTLRPMASLSGVVEGGAGRLVSLLGLGMAVTCDSTGRFRLDSLPSGTLAIAVSGVSRSSSVTMVSGEQGIVLAKVDSLPSTLGVLPADTLIKATGQAIPLSLPRAVLGASGPFAVALRFERTEPATATWLVSWTDGASAGVRLGWEGRDTIVLEVAGKSRKIAGVPLDQGIQQVGLAWNGTKIEVWLGADLLLSLDDTTLADRATLTDPVIAGAGVSRVDLLTFKVGSVPAEWFVRFAGL
ncbi:MAG: hypothetical protein RL318_1320 [Fibrobacterota bacterium]|jgi:hypothetical protein